jgi:O-antigen ligase
MVTSAGMAFFLGLYVSKLWQRWLCFGLAAAMIHVVLFSLSRGGMLAVGVTAIVTFVLIPKQPKVLALFALALIVGLSLAGPEVMARFETTFAEGESRDYSAESRLDLWIACARAMATHPVSGLGLENWKLLAHTYGFTPGKDSHTMWLHIGAEMGVVGLGLLIAFYGFSIVRLWPIAKEKDELADAWATSVARMVIASFAGFAVSAQFVSVHGVELPYYLVLLGAAALKVHSARAPQDPECTEESDDNDFVLSASDFAT